MEEKETDLKSVKEIIENKKMKNNLFKIPNIKKMNGEGPKKYLKY